MADDFIEREPDELSALFQRYKSKYDFDQLLRDMLLKKKMLVDERRTLEDKWEEELNAYNNRPNPQKDETRKTKHKEIIPLVVDAVEENHSQIFRAMFPNTEKFFDIPVGEDALKPAADIVSRFLHADIRNNNLDQIDLAMKGAYLHGMTAPKAKWETKTRKTLFLNLETGKLEEEDITERDGVKVEAVSNFDWLFDTSKPFGEGLFFEKFREDEIQFRKKGKNGIYFDTDLVQPKFTEFRNDNDDNRQAQWEEGKDQADLIAQQEQSRAIGHFDVLVVWGDLPVLNKETQEYEVLEKHRVVIANDAQVISVDPNPNRDGTLNHVPIFYLRSPDTRNPFGISLIRNAMGLFHAANLLFNVLLDLVEIQLKVPREFNPTDIDLVRWLSNFEGGQIDMAGQFVPTRNGTKPMDFNPIIDGIGFQMIGEIINRFGESTKSIKNFTQRDFQKTATEIQGILEQISAFQAKTVSFMQRTFLVPLLRKYWNLFLQYKVAVDPEKAIAEMSKVLGEDVLARLEENNLGPEHLFRAWDFVATGNNFAVFKAKNANALRQALELVLQDPDASVFLKKKELYREYFRNLDLPNLEDLVATDKEIEQILQQQAEQAALQREQEMQDNIAKKEPLIAAALADKEKQRSAVEELFAQVSAGDLSAREALERLEGQNLRSQ